MAEFAFEAGVVTVEEFEAAGFVGESAEGEPCGFGEGFVVAGEGEVADAFGEAGGFDGPEALLTPAGEGHAFDEAVFGGGLGFVFGVEGGEEFEEFLVGFAVEDGALGEETVAGGVGGDGLFAGFGDGAGGVFWALARLVSGWLSVSVLMEVVLWAHCASG